MGFFSESNYLPYEEFVNVFFDNPRVSSQPYYIDKFAVNFNGFPFHYDNHVRLYTELGTVEVFYPAWIDEDNFICIRGAHTVTNHRNIAYYCDIVCNGELVVNDLLIDSYTTTSYYYNASYNRYECGFGAFIETAVDMGLGQLSLKISQNRYTQSTSQINATTQIPACLDLSKATFGYGFVIPFGPSGYQDETYIGVLPDEASTYSNYYTSPYRIRDIHMKGSRSTTQYGRTSLSSETSLSSVAAGPNTRYGTITLSPSSSCLAVAAVNSISYLTVIDSRIEKTNSGYDEGHTSTVSTDSGRYVYPDDQGYVAARFVVRNDHPTHSIHQPALALSIYRNGYYIGNEIDPDIGGFFRYNSSLSDTSSYDLSTNVQGFPISSDNFNAGDAMGHRISFQNPVRQDYSYEFLWGRCVGFNRSTAISNEVDILGYDKDGHDSDVFSCRSATSSTSLDHLYCPTNIPGEGSAVGLSPVHCFVTYSYSNINASAEINYYELDFSDLNIWTSFEKDTVNTSARIGPKAHIMEDPDQAQWSASFRGKGLLIMFPNGNGLLKFDYKNNIMPDFVDYYYQTSDGGETWTTYTGGLLDNAIALNTFPNSGYIQDSSGNWVYYHISLGGTDTSWYIKDDLTTSGTISIDASIPVGTGTFWKAFSLSDDKQELLLIRNVGRTGGGEGPDLRVCKLNLSNATHLTPITSTMTFNRDFSYTDYSSTQAHARAMPTPLYNKSTGEVFVIPASNKGVPIVRTYIYEEDGTTPYTGVSEVEIFAGGYYRTTTAGPTLAADTSIDSGGYSATGVGFHVDPAFTTFGINVSKSSYNKDINGTVQNGSVRLKFDIRKYFKQLRASTHEISVQTPAPFPNYISSSKDLVCPEGRASTALLPGEEREYVFVMHANELRHNAEYVFNLSHHIEVDVDSYSLSSHLDNIIHEPLNMSTTNHWSWKCPFVSTYAHGLIVSQLDSDEVGYTSYWEDYKFAGYVPQFFTKDMYANYSRPFSYGRFYNTEPSATDSEFGSEHIINTQGGDFSLTLITDGAAGGNPYPWENNTEGGFEIKLLSSDTIREQQIGHDATFPKVFDMGGTIENVQFKLWFAYVDTSFSLGAYGYFGARPETQFLESSHFTFSGVTNTLRGGSRSIPVNDPSSLKMVVAVTGARLVTDSTLSAVGEYVPKGKLGQTLLQPECLLSAEGSYQNATVNGQFNKFGQATLDAAPITGVTKTDTTNNITTDSTCSATAIVFSCFVSDFRIRLDDGDDLTATWVASQNEVPLDLVAGQTYRIRFAIVNQGTSAVSTAATFLHYLYDSPVNHINEAYVPVGFPGSPFENPNFELKFEATRTLSTDGLSGVNASSYLVQPRAAFLGTNTYLTPFTAYDPQAGLGFAGVSRSTDQGANWDRTGFFRDLAVSTSGFMQMPVISNNTFTGDVDLYFVANSGLTYYFCGGYSTDNGYSWTPKSQAAYVPTYLRTAQQTAQSDSTGQFFDPNNNEAFAWTHFPALLDSSPVDPDYVDGRAIMSSRAGFRPAYGESGYRLQSSYGHSSSDYYARGYEIPSTTAHDMLGSFDGTTRSVILSMISFQSSGVAEPNGTQKRKLQVATIGPETPSICNASTAICSANLTEYIDFEDDFGWYIPSDNTNPTYFSREFSCAYGTGESVRRGWSAYFTFVKQNGLDPDLLYRMWSRIVMREEETYISYTNKFLEYPTNGLYGYYTWDFIPERPRTIYASGGGRLVDGEFGSEIHILGYKLQDIANKTSVWPRYSEDHNAFWGYTKGTGDWDIDIWSVKNSSNMHLDPTDGELGFGLFQASRQLTNTGPYSSLSFNSAYSFISTNCCGPGYGLVLAPQSVTEIEFSFIPTETIEAGVPIKLEPFIFSHEEAFDVTPAIFIKSPEACNLVGECNVAIAGSVDAGKTSLVCECILTAAPPPALGQTSLTCEATLDALFGGIFNVSTSVFGKAVLTTDGRKDVLSATSFVGECEITPDALCSTEGSTSLEATSVISASCTVFKYGKTRNIRGVTTLNLTASVEKTGVASLICVGLASNKGFIGWSGQVRKEGIDLIAYQCNPEAIVVQNAPLKLVKCAPKMTVLCKSTTIKTVQNTRSITVSHCEKVA